MGQTSGLVRSVIPERHIPPFNKVQILDGVTGQAATLPVSPKILLTSDILVWSSRNSIRDNSSDRSIREIFR